MLNIDTSEVLQRISLDVAERYNYPQLVNEAAVEGVLGHPHQKPEQRPLLRRRTPTAPHLE